MVMLIEIEPECISMRDGMPVVNGQPVEKHYFEKGSTFNPSILDSIFDGERDVHFCSFNGYELFMQLEEPEPEEEVKEYTDLYAYFLDNPINNHYIDEINKKKGIYTINKVSKYGKNLDLNKLISDLGDNFDFKANGETVFAYRK